jgi:hypothetical protein
VTTPELPQPTPRLRRGPAPSETNGRKVLIGVAAFFLLLLAFVLILVFTIGIHNNGVKPPPPGQPTRNSQP